MADKFIPARPGIGPIGLTMTVLVWAGFLYGEQRLGVPKMSIYPLLRLFLLLMFLIDATYLVGGGMYTMVTNNWREKMVTSGPFFFVRHPLYSALIYSATGALALWQYSWGLLVSVVPLSFLWSWLAVFEEQKMIRLYGQKYEQYCQTTGQFLPSFKKLNDKAEQGLQ